MKKIYVKPVGQMIHFTTNENIAASNNQFNGNQDSTSEITYTYSTDGSRKYIAFSDIPAANSSDEAYNKYYDTLIAYLYGLRSNCGRNYNGPMLI